MVSRVKTCSITSSIGGSSTVRSITGKSASSRAQYAAAGNEPISATRNDDNGKTIVQVFPEASGEDFFPKVLVCRCDESGLDAFRASAPDPPDLIKSLKLISRSPALVLGTAVDKPVDGGLHEAFLR